MKTNHESAAVDEPNLERAKHCLALIRDIAARGERSADPEHVGYALQELSQVLLERTGTQEIDFEPCPVGQVVVGGSSRRTRLGGLFLTILRGVGDRTQRWIYLLTALILLVPRDGKRRMKPTRLMPWRTVNLADRDPHDTKCPGLDCFCHVTGSVA